MQIHYVKGISAVIPNYNGKALLAEVLPPLFIALQRAGLPYEVIVSDDSSTDDSVSFLKHTYPAIVVIENKINRGFSPTINKGIYKAQFDYVLLMNSDVKLTENYFIPLMKYMDRPDTFGVMGRIVGWDNDKIQDGAKFPYFHGKKIKTSGNYIPLNHQEGNEYFSMYLSGANAFVSRSKLIELGGFDEIYAPFYVEDYDLSLRAWRLGYTCYYEHSAICRHQESVSIKTKEKKTFINTIYYRNKMFLHAIHLPKAALKAWSLQNSLECFIQSLLGKKYYMNALRLFSGEADKWKQSGSALEQLGERKSVLLSVRQVADKILNSLEGKNIQKF